MRRTLFLDPFIDLDLGLLVMACGYEPPSFEDEALDLKQMESIVLLYFSFGLEDLTIKLLYQWVVRVLNHVHQVLLHDLKQLVVCLVHCCVVDDGLLRLDHPLRLLGQHLLGGTGPGLASLVLGDVIHVYVLLVDVRVCHQRAVLPHDLSLEAEFPVAHRSKEGLAPRLSLLPSLKLAHCFLLHLLSVDDLSGREPSHYLVLYLQEVQSEFLVQRVLEVLGHKHEQI